MISVSPIVDVPGSHLAQAGQALGQLALPVAGNARQPDNFPGVQLQVDAAQRLCAAVAHGMQTLNFQAHLAGCARLRGQRFHFPPDHHVDQFIPADLSGNPRADHPAVPQHGHPVADGHDLVQLVGDENQGVAFTRSSGAG